MNKTLMIVTLFLSALFILSACNGDANDPSDPTGYDNRSLVTEECEHLDNIDTWQPVWCDEFDQDGLPSSAHWSYDVGGHGWGNNELQYYTSERLDNAFVEDGILNIKAIKENYMGSTYTSARLVSKYKGDFEYGRFVISARMPSGRGTWPAVWMLPTEWRYGDWPFSGEIDIMEYVGYDPGVVHGTIHTGAYNHGLNTQIGYSKNVPTAEDEFHEYEMIWEPGRIVMMIDGVQYAQFGYNPESNMDISNSDAWPFDQPFHMILNLAIGGNWGGAQGVDPNLEEALFEVDYVRVYQKDYSGMDEVAPTEVSDLRLHHTTHNTARVAWDKASDDVLVHEYHIYVGEDLVGTTTLNAFNIEDLDPKTRYTVSVEAVDFKGQTSEKESLTITTESVREITEIIQAERYDNDPDVSLERTEDSTGEYNVGWIDDGDTLEYLLEVKEAGDYVVNYRVASESSGGEIELLLRSRFPLTSTVFEATGAWQEWTTITSETVSLDAGIYTFRLRAKQGGFNLNYFTFEKVE